MWMMSLLLHVNMIMMMIKSTKFEPTKTNDKDKIVYRSERTMKNG